MLRKDLFLSSLVTVLVLCLSRCAQAQDVVMPDGKELPTEVMLDEDGKKMFCWVASEGELPLEEPNADSEPVFASNSFDWMKTMYVMAEHTTDEGDFVLVAQPRGNDRPPQVQGWVRKGVLIFGANHALRSTEGGKLFQKVRLSNTNISLLDAQQTNSVDVSGVPIYRSPSSESDPIDTIQLATLFFVYGEANGFVLVGRREDFSFSEGQKNEPLYKDNVIRGWVPINRIVRWNTRQAMAWNWWSTGPNAKGRRDTPGIVFGHYVPEPGEQPKLDEKASLSAANDYLAKVNEYLLEVELGGGDVGSRPEPKKADVLYREKFVPNTKKIAAQFQTVPMDVPQRGAGEKLSEKTDVEVSRPFASRQPRHPIDDDFQEVKEGTNVLYKVGYSAKFSDDAFDMNELQDKLAAVRAGIGKLDLMILVDQTSSMREVFPQVAQAVALIFRGVISGGSQDVRISVSFYGDREAAGENAFEINPFVSIAAQRFIDSQESKAGTQEFLDRYLANIRNIQSAEDFDILCNPQGRLAVDADLVDQLKKVHLHSFQGGGDPLEDVFRGIQEAGSAAFRTQCRKLMLVIGDRGDKSGELSRGNSDDSKMRLIAKLLDRGKKQIPVELLAINVDDSNHADAQLFTRQMGRLQELVNINDRDKRIKVISGENRVESVANLIKQQYDRQLKWAQEMEEDIRALSEGSFSREIGKGTIRHLEASGIDVESLAATTGNEIFAEGFVWMYDPWTNIQQVRPQILLTEQELCELIRELDEAFGDDIFNDGIGDVRLDTVMNMIELNAGQNAGGADQTLADALSMGLELPFQSQLMRMTPEQLMKKRQDKTNGGMAELKKEIAGIRVKLKRLKDLCEINMDLPANSTENRLKGGFWSDWRMKEKVGQDGVAYTIPEYTTRISLPESRAFTYPNDFTDTKWYWIDLQEEFP
jgi:hypothetical protein